MLGTKPFAMATSTNPCVPVSPVTTKLSWLLAELKDNADTVELEVTENTVCSENGTKDKETILLVPLHAVFPFHLALIRKFPDTGGIHVTRNAPSEPVNTDVRSVQMAPPLTLYEMNTGALGMAVLLDRSVPLISTLKPM